MFQTPAPPATSKVPLTEAPRRFSGADALPLHRTDLEALTARLYHRAIAGEPISELQGRYCQELARKMSLALVAIAKAMEGGSLMIEAASHESGLWLDLQRLPERWDSGIASQGPGGMALLLAAPAHFATDDDGFALWRNAALKEHVSEVLALPLPGTPRRVLELFFDKPIAEGVRADSLSAAELATHTAQFFEDLDRLARSQLVCHALEAAGAGAFITDLDATIVWCNAAFSALSGFTPAQVIGQKPNLLRSGQQTLRYYRDLWETIRTGKTWTSETVDRAKDGSTYSILQTVSPVATNGRISHYVSIHQDIGRQRHEREKLQAMSREDPVTGMLTRAAFEDSAQKVVQAAVETSSPAVLVILSMRGLREVARTLSAEQEAHLMGDIGKRLRRLVPWLTGYYGAGEFAMLFADEEAREETALLTRLAAIEEALKEPLDVPGGRLECHARFGVAHFPVDGLSLDLLLKRADRRLANEPYHRAHRRAPLEGNDS